MSKFKQLAQLAISTFEKIAGFNPVFYTELYPDVRGLSRVALLKHWIDFGKYEGRIQSWKSLAKKYKKAGIAPQSFDAFTYLSIHSGLDESGIRTTAQAAVHFLNFGSQAGLIAKVVLPQFLEGVAVSTDSEKRWDLSPQVAKSDCNNKQDSAHLYGFDDRTEQFLASLSSEEFIIECFRYFQSHPPEIRYLDHLCTQVDYGNVSRTYLLVAIATSGGFEISSDGVFQKKSNHELAQAKDFVEKTTINLSLPLSVMGIEIMTRAEWYQRAFFSLKSLSKHPGEIESNTDHKIHLETVKHIEDPPIVSVLCSLYRTDDHLSRFISNITEQTFFSRSEFIFILVDPSPFELKVCNDLKVQYTNIVLDIHKSRIGIYEAWNSGIRLAKGKYLTNMNVDDFRRMDSLQIQVNLLESNSWVDIVYQDVHVTLSPELSWKQIEAIDSILKLPIANNALFMSYRNPPHNAPMWRASLHDEVGLFNEEFRSAGDVDFWIRCSRAGKVFFNIPDPHVSYYENPFGLSTEIDSPGLWEQRRIIDQNRDLMISVSDTSMVCELRDSYTRSRADRLTLGMINILMSERSGESFN